MDIGNRELAAYLKAVIADFHADNNLTKALRRMHIKEVHCFRNGNYLGLELTKMARRLL